MTVSIILSIILSFIAESIISLSIIYISLSPSVYILVLLVLVLVLILILVLVLVLVLIPLISRGASLQVCILLLQICVEPSTIEVV